MTKSKHVLLSETFWFGVAQIALGAYLLLTSHSVEDKHLSLGIIFTGIGTIHGRLKAKHRLTWKKKGD